MIDCRFERVGFLFGSFFLVPVSFFFLDLFLVTPVLS